jgi:hypothetical protein
VGEGARRRRAGEGSDRNSKFNTDSIKDSVEILNEFVIPEALDTKSVIFQELGSRSVIGDVLSLAVLAAVEFDDQLFFKADEVRDVGTDGLLPPEFVATKSSTAECLPQLPFEVGLLAAKLSGEFVFHASPLT